MTYYQRHKEERLAYQKQYHNEKNSDYCSYQLQYYHEKIKNSEHFKEQRLKARRKFYDKKHRENVERRQLKRIEALKLKLLRELKRVLKKRYIEPISENTEPLVIFIPEVISDVFKDYKVNSRGMFYLEW